MRSYNPIDITNIILKDKLADAPITDFLDQISSCNDTDYDTVGAKDKIDAVCRYAQAFGKPNTPEELKSFVMKRINSIVSTGKLEAAQFLLSLKGQTINKTDILSIHKEQSVQRDKTPFVLAIEENKVDYIFSHLSNVGEPIKKSDMFDKNNLTYNESNKLTVNGRIAAFAIAKHKYELIEKELNKLGERTNINDLRNEVTVEDESISTNGSSMIMAMLYTEPKTLSKILRQDSGKLVCADISEDLEEPKYFHQTAIKNFLGLGNQVMLDNRALNNISNTYIRLRKTYETNIDEASPLPKVFTTAKRIAQIHESKQKNVSLIANQRLRGR